MNMPGTFAWLILGAIVQLAGCGHWMTLLGAWLAPVFFLHFTHSLPPLAGLLWACSALAIAPGTNLRGIVPIPGLAYLSLPMVWGLFGALPFVVDRLAASLVPGL